MHRIAGNFTAVIFALSAARAQAQGHDVEVSIGVAATVGLLAKSEGPFKMTRVGVTQRRPESVVRFRIDGEVLWGAQSAGTALGDDIRAFGVGYSALFAKQRKGFYPYAMLGLGTMWVRESYAIEVFPPGGINVNTVVNSGQYLSPRVGVGVRGKLGGAQLHAEAGLIGFLSSAFGASSGYLRAGYVPLTIGLAF